MKLEINGVALLGISMLIAGTFLLNRLSTDAITMMIGMLFGLMAGLPALALVMKSFTHNREKQYTSDTNQLQRRPVEPQLIFTQQAAAQTIPLPKSQGSHIEEKFLDHGFDCKMVNQVQHTSNHFIYEFIFGCNAKLSDILDFINTLYRNNADFDYQVITRGAVIQIHQTETSLDVNYINRLPPQRLIGSSYPNGDNQLPVPYQGESQHAY